MSKGITIHISGASRFQESEKKPGMHYFELRTGDSSSETLIADRVVVNNEGSIEADRDILADAIAAGEIPDRTWNLPWEALEKLYENVTVL